MVGSETGGLLKRCNISGKYFNVLHWLGSVMGPLRLQSAAHHNLIAESTFGRHSLPDTLNSQASNPSSFCSSRLAGSHYQLGEDARILTPDSCLIKARD